VREVVIVGASLAGVRSAEQLRRLGFNGRITLVNGEAHLPYDRPPLSKQLLTGGREPDSILLCPPARIEELRLGLINGHRAVALDCHTQQVILDDHRRLDYDSLLIATGSVARSLPGAEALDGVHPLRTVDDSLAIAKAMAGGRRVVIVGAGFIGAEVASSARELGLDVVLLEGASAPLIRIFGSTVGEYFADLHRRNGVDLRCEVPIAAIEGAGRVERVVLADGATIDTDLVVVGIGARPATDWLQSSDLTLQDGVVCDEHLRAVGVANVYAAGDVARWPHPGLGLTRAEHWTNAVEQAATVAHNMMAPDSRPFTAIPYVWSDQYGLKFQLYGNTHSDDRVELASGALAEDRFVVCFGRGEQFTGALGVRSAKKLLAARNLLEGQASFAEALAGLR
jgi:NADPH-dependent 2,4-dienoyl-CoA reductase/sulfur reductase-like enzyme